MDEPMTPENEAEIEGFEPKADESDNSEGPKEENPEDKENGVDKEESEVV